MAAPSRLVTAATIGLLVLIWGTTWAGIRVGLEGIPPLTGVGLRFLIAGLVLGGIALARGIPLTGDRQGNRLLLANSLLSFCLSYGVVYWAEQWLPSGLAAVLFATFPFFVAALAHLWLPLERLSARTVLGTVVGFAGVGVIFSEDLFSGGLLSGEPGSAPGPGMLTVALVFLLSPLASAVGNVAIKKWGGSLHPFTLTTLPMGFAGLLMGLLGLLLERDRPLVLDPVSVGALLYLSLLGSAVTFTLYFWLLSHLPVTRLSLITYGVPAVAVAVGALVLDEPYTPRMLVGSLMVLVGVAIARPRRAVGAEPAAG